MLNNPKVNPNKIEQGLRVALDHLASNPLFPENKFSEWLDRVSLLANENFTKSYIEQVHLGVIESTKSLSITNSVILLSKALQTAAAVTDGTATVESLQQISQAIEQLNLGVLLELIQMIFKLLLDLGILGG